MLREYLTNSGFDYDDFDVDRDDAARRFVLVLNDGRWRFPVIVVQHRVLTQPTVAILQRVLRDVGVATAARRTRLFAGALGGNARPNPAVT